MSLLTRSSRASRIALITAFSAVVAGLSLGGAAATASADPTTYQITGPDWATALTQIHSATSAATDGDEIQLGIGVDVPIDHAQTITFSHSMTLDLNGNFLDINQILIGAGKTLTIQDTGGGGSITTDADTYFGSPAPGIVVNSGESLVINGGTISANGATQANSGPGIGPSSGNAGSVTINGGDVYATAGNDGAGIGGSAGHSGGAFTMTGGTLHAYGAGGGAGIGGSEGGSGGTVHISGGNITANGAGSAAGIGGGSSGGTGAIDIEGGTVDANAAGAGAAIGSGAGANAGDITINAANVTAGASQAAAIGAGFGGKVGNILIGTNADVTASSSNPSQDTSVVGGTSFTSFELAGALHVSSGNFAVIPSGNLLTIDSTGRLDGDGSLLGAGAVVNNGVIQASQVSDAQDAGGTLTITGNDFLVNFDPSSPNSNATNTETSERLYAPSFDTAGLGLPALADQQAEIALGWDSTPNSGSLWDTSTDFSSPTTTLYGQWDAVASISVNVGSSTFTAGGNTSYQVIGTGFESETSDQTAWANVSSDDASDVVDGEADTVTATKSGTHTIHASLASLANNATVTGLTTFDVTAGDAGAPPVLEFLAAPATAYPGVYFNYALATTDSYGNPVSAVTTKVKSNKSSDTVKGSTVKFAKVGEHTITATSGSATKTTTTNVVLDTTTIDLTGTPITQTAGQTKSVIVHLTPGLSDVTPVGSIRVYYGTKYIKATVTKASGVTVKLPKFTKSGTYSIYVKYYGSGTYAALTGASFDYTVTPAVVKALVFENTSSKGYLGTSNIYADEVDAYGNMVNQYVDYTLVPTGAGATVTYPNNGYDPLLELDNLGKVTLTGTDGTLVATRKLTVIKDTPVISGLPGASLVGGANVDDVTVGITTPHSNVLLTGSLTLHFGSKTYSGVITSHDYGNSYFYTVAYDLSALPEGSYSTYFTLPGTAAYNAVTTKKKTTKLVAG